MGSPLLPSPYDRPRELAAAGRKMSYFYRAVPQILLLCMFTAEYLGVNPVIAKFVHGKASVSSMSRVDYMSNFGCGIGQCLYKFRFQLDNPAALSLGATSERASLAVNLFLDQEWNKEPVNRTPQCSTIQKSRTTRSVVVPLNGTWSDWILGYVAQSVRPHVWYFVLDDCNGNFQAQIQEAAMKSERNTGRLNELKVKWDASFTQANGSHLPYELQRNWIFSVFQLICYIVVSVVMAIREIAAMKNSGRLHIMLLLLNVCILTQIVSLIFHLAHLGVYSYNGRGIKLLDMLGETAGLVSQIMLSSVLIMISLGYSLSVNKSFKWMEHQGPTIVICVTLIHVLAVWISHFSIDSRFRHFSTDGFIGTLLVALRFCLWALFIVSCVKTWSSVDTPTSVKHFLRKFSFAGSLYFLAYPLVLLITKLHNAHLQHSVISAGTFIMQLCSILWLCFLFLTRGEYFQLSELNRSYLPGGYLPSPSRCRLD